MCQSCTDLHFRRLTFWTFVERLFIKMSVHLKGNNSVGKALMKLTSFSATHLLVINRIWCWDNPTQFSRFNTCRVWPFWLQILLIILDLRNNLPRFFIDIFCNDMQESINISKSVTAPAIKSKFKHLNFDFSFKLKLLPNNLTPFRLRSLHPLFIILSKNLSHTFFPLRSIF